MVAAIQQRTKSVSPTTAQPAAELKIIPITGLSSSDPPYRLLDKTSLEAVRVTETSEQGTVPELIVENTLDFMVFLMDGQELIGEKQNRILNTDVLVPAKSRIRIPVSCVEQGRWSRTSRGFTPGKSASHRTRSNKMRRVRTSLEQSKTHDADQGKVWDEVAFSLNCSDSRSPTRALSDAYIARNKQIEQARAKLSLPDDAVGLAVVSGDALMGVDLFDRHSTCQHYWQNLVDSYLLDPVQPGPTVAGPESPEAELVQEVLSQLESTAWRSHDSPGAGVDQRLSTERLEASALVWEDKTVVHLQAFPQNVMPK